MARVGSAGLAFGAAAILIICGRIEAAPWSLVPCDASGEPGWKTFAQAMRTAKPGAPLYVPIPFPTTPAEVLKDFTYQYWKVIDGLSPKNWQPAEPRVMAALRSGQFTFQVVRAENWTVSHCRTDRKNDFYYIVRVFEPGGTEVTRAAINDSGVAVTWNDLPASVPGPVASQSRTMPPAATAMAQLNATLGIDGVDSQYVVTFGSIDCGFTHPCLTFRRSGLAYLAYSDDLYEISARGPRFLLGKDVGTPATDALLRSLAPNERLVSLGGKAFSLARQVTPAMVRSGRSAFAP